MLCIRSGLIWYACPSGSVPSREVRYTNRSRRTEGVPLPDAGERLHRHRLHGDVLVTPSEYACKSARERKRKFDSLESQGVYPTVDDAGRWGTTIEAIE